MIDIWMAFTMTIPFLEVVLHTFNEVSKRPYIGSNERVGVIRVKPDITLDEEEIVETNSSTSTTFILMRLTRRLMLPISSTIFTIIFGIVGLIKSFSSDEIQDPSLFECLSSQN